MARDININDNTVTVDGTNGGLDGTILSSVYEATGATYTIDGTYNLILCSYTSTGNVTVTLASGAQIVGRIYTIMDIGGGASANAISLDGDGELINEGGDGVELATDYGCWKVVWDGTEWWATGTDITVSAGG